MLIINLHYKIAGEETVIRIDCYTSEHQFVLLRNDRGKVCHNTYIIIAHNAQSDSILSLTLSAPSRFHHTIAEARLQIRGIRTILMMYLDSTVDCHKAKDWIAVDRLATTCQSVVDSVHITVDNKGITG